MTIKNPEKYDLINTSANFDSKFIVFEILKCNVNTSSVGCASPEEIKDYVNNRSLGLISNFNFVDYDDVEPYKGPLKNTVQWIEFFPLTYSEKTYSMKRHSLKEH